jgi:hypothetical protein
VTARSWNEGHLGLGSKATLHFAANQSGSDKGLVGASQQLGLAFYAVPGEEVTSKETLMDLLSRSLNFREWFGKNWDALRDVLRDFSWSRSGGYVILFRNAHVLARNAPDEFRTFIGVAADVTHDWREWEVPFHFVFTGPPELMDILSQITDAQICVHSTT